MFKKIFPVLVALCLLCTSCATFHNYSSVPYVALNSSNFEYVRPVETTVSFTYFCGIGGFNRGDVNAQLIEAADLKDGEALADVSYHSQFSIVLGLFINKKVTATAQVVRFN